MQDFLFSTQAQVVIWSAVLLGVIALGAFIVERCRDRTDDDRQSASDILTNFRELHQQGDIDDSEFRDIKTVLGTKIQQELKDSDEKG